MKRIQNLVLTFSLAILTTVAFSQIKVVAPNGDVGIGTSTPSEKLEVNGGVMVGNTTNTNAGTIRYNGSDLEGYVNGSWTSLTAAGSGGGGGSVWTTGTGNDIYYDTSGGVGIGVQNPTKKLEVQGGDVKFYGKNLDIGQDAANFTSKFRIGHGRSTDGTSTIDLISDQSNYPIVGFRFNRNTVGVSTLTHYGNQQFIFQNVAASNIYFKVANAHRFTIRDYGSTGINDNNPDASTALDVGGAIGYNGTLVNTSDKRLKKDVRDFRRGLEAVMGLNTMYYHYTGDLGTDSEMEHVGIYAQDLQAVAPELVNEAEYDFSDFDIINHDSGEVELIDHAPRAKASYLTIDESAIKYMLINAIQDQQAQIEEKDDQINDLNDRLDALEEMVNAMAQGNAVQNVELKESGALLQNSPNPFNEKTAIQYVLPEGANNAVIYVNDMNGKAIKTIVLDKSRTGEININANTLGAGSYSYSLVVDGEVVDTKRMVLTK